MGTVNAGWRGVRVVRIIHQLVDPVLRVGGGVRRWIGQCSFEGRRAMRIPPDMVWHEVCDGLGQVELVGIVLALSSMVRFHSSK